uniref:type I polyketide synthase n=1 Tax=Sciscionella sediminilitoris TaxID=1445613 RepID=UPI0012E3219D
MSSSQEQVVTALRKSLRDNELLRRENAELRARDTDPVVIVGMACRFPGGVAGPGQFWELLAHGRDAIGPIPANRGWDPELVERAPGGGFLEDVAGFDAGFFGISPREALAMDPQQRLLLEVAWEALERAGIDPGSVRGSRTGVFIGASNQEYGSRLTGLGAEVEGHVMTGNTLSVVSGRLAYVLGVTGQAVTVDTACSSSLVALHQAVAAVRGGECGRALVGGVAVMSSPGPFVEFAKQGGLSGDGRCKAFAEGADGTGWGEGVGVLVVERLSSARAAGREVLAVVRGSAVNSDGASNGLTAPNGSAQRRVIEDALASAGLDAADVDAVEAHGTGTALGDPIEASALLATYGAADRETPLWLGSVKSNIGHGQAAAGVAGVIKMVLSLQRRVLPATLHVREPSRLVEWDSGAVRLLTESRSWPGESRRAGVSSFGISGTNAHVILEQPPEENEEPAPPVEGNGLPWVLSAQDRTALANLSERLLRFTENDSASDAEIGTALATQRAALTERAVILGGTERSAPLRALAAETTDPALVTGSARHGDTALLFPGQGSQRLGMGRELCAAAPVFGAAFEQACAALESHVDGSLENVLWGADAETLADTGWAQPALFAFQVAGFRLAESWEMLPGALLGHSVGEIAAAQVSGALSLADAARLVAVRARAMARLPRAGAMAAVSGDPERLAELVAGLPDGVSVAAFNSSVSVVLSGVTETVESVLAGLGTETRVSWLRTSHAFHSPLMAPAAEELAAVVAELDWSAPRVPVISTVTGRELGPREWADPGYWARQLTEPVRFADAGVVAFGSLGVRRALELGGHPQLLGHLAADHPEAELIPLGHRDHREPEAADRAAAALWCSGAELPGWIPRLPEGKAVPRVELPTYPFTHERFWAGEDTEAPSGALFTVDWVENPGHDGESECPQWIEVTGADAAETVTRALSAVQEQLNGTESPVLFVTRNAVAAEPGERPDPAQAAVRGLLLTAMAEEPGRFRLLDLPSGTPTELPAELLPAEGEPDVAVRGDRRRVPRWRERETAPQTGIPEGPVLITGGTGGIGAVLARHLAENGAQELVLLSRRGPAAPGAAELRAGVEAAGASVDIRACDVAEPGAFAAVLDTLPTAPALVVHAAGILDDGILANQDGDRITAVLRAKLDAVLAIDAALEDQIELLVFSSVAGQLGAAGQSGYAAANASLDAWATARERDGARRRSIAWGPWDLGAGMARPDERRAGAGLLGLRREQGLALFDAARSVSGPVLVAANLHRDRLAALGTALPPAWRGLAPESGSARAGERERLAGLPAGERLAEVLAAVRAEAAAVLGHRGPRAIAADRDFRGLGFDSLTSVELRNRLAALTGERLPAGVVFDHPSPRRLAGHLADLLGGATAEVRAPAAATVSTVDDPVVIVGMACRFPGGVAGPEEFWELLRQGGEVIGPPPEDRGWDLARYADALRPGAFLDDVAGFDADFFGISGREALAMDPQQRLVLETAWEALERSGIDPASIRGTRTGVFLGTNGQDYSSVLLDSGVDVEGHLGTGNAASVLSGRLAYVLGLEGVAVTVDTACSSSLVALHQAAAA